MSAITRLDSASDGFRQVTLANDCISVSVLPALGGKISSLRHLASGREWMWKPAGFRGFFSSEPGDAFQDGTLVGWDECLPTVSRCSWNGRELPDHGEVWTAPCDLDEGEWENGVIATSLELPRSPFRFVRRLSLEGCALNVDYRLTNRAPAEECYVWAMHPLLAMEEGDQLVIPLALQSQLAPKPGMNTFDLRGEGWARKFFAEVQGSVETGVRNPARGRSLMIHWDAEENPLFGLWLTRGGWHGHHHLALEPTNARDDSLTDASARGVVGRITARETKNWRVKISLF